VLGEGVRNQIAQRIGVAIIISRRLDMLKRILGWLAHCERPNTPAETIVAENGSQTALYRSCGQAPAQYLKATAKDFGWLKRWS